MEHNECISVIILFFINLINYMDRFTVASVLPKVKNFYGINTTESGLLQTVFIISYMIMAPVFGYLGDRYSRKYLMAAGILFWSTTTFLGSMIPASFPFGFYMMRALVGVGEASYSTLAPTIIADLFPREMRTRMLAFFYFAIPVGSGLGYVIGSEVAAKMHDWRWALKVTPPLGVISVICLLVFLEERPRGFSDGAVEPQEKSDLVNDIKYLLTVRSYIWLTIAFTCVSFSIGALSWYAPTYIQLATNVSGENVPLEDIDFIFGIITCLAGIIGVISGSGGAQYYRKFNLRADPLVCGFAVLVGVPFAFIGIVVPHQSLITSWILIFIGVTCFCMNWALVADILLYVIVPNKRGMAQALQILTSHLLGDAFSPFIIGFIVDAIRHGRETDQIKYYSLQYSLYITSFVLILGAGAFLYTASFIVGDQEKCKNQMQAQIRQSSPSETSIHTLPPNDLTFSPMNNDDSFIQSYPPSTALIDHDYNQVQNSLIEF